MNMKSADKVTDLYLSLRRLVMITYMDCTWWILDFIILLSREPLPFPKIYSDFFVPARDMGDYIIFLFAT